MLDMIILFAVYGIAVIVGVLLVGKTHMEALGGDNDEDCSGS